MVNIIGVSKRTVIIVCCLILKQKYSSPTSKLDVLYFFRESFITEEGWKKEIRKLLSYYKTRILQQTYSSIAGFNYISSSKPLKEITLRTKELISSNHC